MSEGKSPVRLGKLGGGVLIALLAYCAALWLPVFADNYILGISLNVWGGLSLFLVAPCLGLVFAMSQTRDADDSSSDGPEGDRS